MSDSLSNARSRLAVRDAPAASSAESSSSSFRLQCSDGETVSVDSALLSAASPVFKDMLEVGAGQPVCKVTESSRAIKFFLEAVKEGKVPSGEQDSRSLYRMMNKYDPAAV
ncbi:hypothetical protein JCM8097_009322 [Rhodosporidiobolus ruineniae]